MARRGRPSRQDVFRALDRSLSDLSAVGGLPIPVEAEGLWEDFWKEETHHSTAIEGNTLVLRQVKILLEEGRAVGNKELREYLEIEGYADAARWVYAHAIRGFPGPEQRDFVNVTEVRHIHKLVLDPVWERFAPEDAHPAEGPGGFRRCELNPLRPDLKPPAWSDVPPRINDWLGWANSRPVEGVHLIEHLSALHSAFERIHPFRDGNGRVGRLLLNLLLVRYGAPPAIVLKRDRAKYLRGLKRADDGDAGPLGELFARAVRYSIENRVLPALAGPQRLVPLQSLVSSELSRAALQSAAKRDRLRTVKMADELYSTRQWVADYRGSRQQGRKLTPESESEVNGTESQMTLSQTL